MKSYEVFVRNTKDFIILLGKARCVHRVSSESDCPLYEWSKSFHFHFRFLGSCILQPLALELLQATDDLLDILKLYPNRLELLSILRLIPLNLSGNRFTLYLLLNRQIQFLFHAFHQSLDLLLHAHDLLSDHCGTLVQSGHEIIGLVHQLRR